jgi:broad specificity phosphatase PhoE
MGEPLQKLYLIRHGNTEWSETHRFTGRSDLPLNDLGERNARRLAVRLQGISFSKVFVSPLQRARRTCELAGLLPGAEITPDLYEWDYGSFDGRFSEEVRTENPGWNLFRDGCPGGESPHDVMLRADHFIARVRQLEGNVAAFASGHIIRSITARWIGLPMTGAGLFICSTASIGILGYEHGPEEPAVELWNSEDKG